MLLRLRARMRNDKRCARREDGEPAIRRRKFSTGLVVLLLLLWLLWPGFKFGRVQHERGPHEAEGGLLGRRAVAVASQHIRNRVLKHKRIIDGPCRRFSQRRWLVFDEDVPAAEIQAPRKSPQSFGL